MKLFYLFFIMISNPIKKCINCKYFLPDGYENGKCKLFRITNKERNFDSCSLEMIYNIYHTCTLARLLESKCGKEGRFYTGE